MKRAIRSLFACGLSLLGTSALATNFFTFVDPATGRPTLVMMSGVSNARPAPTIPLPAQSANPIPQQQPSSPPPQIINSATLSYITSQASPDIIQTLIRNRQAIDQENQNFMNQQREASQPPSPQSGQEDLDRLASNLDKLVDNALQQALQNRDTTPSADNGSQAGAQGADNNNPLLSAAQLEAQRRALASRLSGSNDASQPDSLQPDAPANAGVVADVLTQQLAANMARQASQGTGSPAPPMDRTAGVDPEAQRQREQQRQQAEQRRQQQVQQKEDKKQEVANSNQQLIEQIQNAARQQQEANQQAQQQKQQEAMDRLQEQMTLAEREALQQRQDNRQAQGQQSPPASSTPSAPSQTAAPRTAGNNPAGGEMSYENMISQLYIAFFNRPADAQGLAFWQDALENSQNGELGPLLDALAGSGESQTFPAGDQQRDLIANVYLALFGRPTDPSGLAFWQNALDPSQESLRQMEDALKQAVAKQAAEKIPSTPLVNEYDPWGSYIYVARQERSPALPETGLYEVHHAYYKGDVRGTVGDDTVEGKLKLMFELSPVGTIGGSIQFQDNGALSINGSLADRASAAFTGELSGDAFGGYASGSLNGAVYGPNGQQVGGTWNLDIREGDLLVKSGEGRFAGEQVAPFELPDAP